MGWFNKSEKVSALEHEIVILRMQVAGLLIQLKDCDALVTLLDSENKMLKPKPDPLPNWDGPDSA